MMTMYAQEWFENKKARSEAGFLRCGRDSNPRPSA
jgi:hypothetical protein